MEMILIERQVLKICIFKCNYSQNFQKNANGILDIWLIFNTYILFVYSKYEIYIQTKIFVDLYSLFKDK